MQTKKKLKGNVSIRTKASAAERLDQHLLAHPQLSETDVTAAALNHYFDALAAAPLALPEAEKIEEPMPLTAG